MTHPLDLNTEEGRSAYRVELRRVAWPIRISGFALVILGALAVLAPRWISAWPNSLVAIGWGVLVLGWVLFITAIVLRTRYHRRRLAELGA
ncbi:MAG: hypothetical protein EON87_19145 [Brevundimonas sp.]|nr:MAG: hypothetical protein EON87_19145 [Brevundimonas sp.]